MSSSRDDGDMVVTNPNPRGRRDSLGASSFASSERDLRRTGNLCHKLFPGLYVIDGRGGVGMTVGGGRGPAGRGDGLTK